MIKRYRISIPLTPEAKLALEDYAEATSSGIGASASAFLHEMAPSIHQLADAIREARKDPMRGVSIINMMADEARQSLDKEQKDINEKVKK